MNKQKENGRVQGEDCLSGFVCSNEAGGGLVGVELCVDGQGSKGERMEGLMSERKKLLI